MRKSCIVLLIFFTVPWLAEAQTPAEGTAAGIDTFNRAFADATRHMDSAGILALWEDDGISLLPSMKPLVGKKAIGKFLADVMASIPGAKMESFEQRCFDLLVSGAWASEWCTEHQIVSIPGKPSFNGWGKMALILHRDADGQWRLRQEMWNQATALDPAAH